MYRNSIRSVCATTAGLVWLAAYWIPAMAIEPLALPDTFDATEYMVGSSWEGGSYHSVRGSAELAEQLVANGAPEDIALAEKILDAVFACQELHPGDANYGNYFWTKERGVVEDLNSVAFVQRYLLPLAIRHRDRLSEHTRSRLLESIRLGCMAIRRMDVAVTYTNVASMHVLSCCLGGELLKDAELAQYGYDKMARLSAVTAANGAVFEFNSPTYVRVTIDALDRLADLVQDAGTRIRARTMVARLALTTALRLHRPTGYLTGPHSRAGYDLSVCAGEPEAAFVAEWIKEGAVPDWVARAASHTFAPAQIDETAHAGWRIGTTAYLSESFVLGTATREISRQTNPFIAHCRTPGGQVPAVMLTRYLIDDAWFGDPLEPADRDRRPRLVDSGQYLGVQWGPRAIALYAPKTLQHPASLAPVSLDRFRSAKLVIVWTQR